MMGTPDYSALVARQREYFLSGVTRPAAWRKARLEAVKALFTENHDELCEALWKDLRRNVTDADLMDVAYNVKEADYALAHLDAWMEPQLVHTPLVFEPGHIRVRRDPLGVTLIISAWNEPFMLLFAPLVAALAGGNTAVLKPSELAVACSTAAARLVPKYFDPRAVGVDEGAVPETTALLNQKSRGRQDRAQGGCAAPDTVRVGARRQEPDNRARVREPEVGRAPHRLRALPELRAHLHCPRPRARVARGQGRVRPPPRRDDSRVLRRRS